ncbi:hypothetical protein P8605_35545, partial [Streptomyces sp. T-3]|nr:hypothetical protein [Streptomyces sp. T-3]
LADDATTTAALAAARTAPGVVDATLYRAPGEQVAPAKDFRGRLGHVIAVTDHTAAGPAAESGRQALTAAIDLRTTQKAAAL